MNKFFVILTAVAAVAMAMPATAGSCSTSEPEVTTPDGAKVYYIDIDGAGEGIWIYEESNGRDGLQRADDMKDDTDGGTCFEADTLIY